MYPHLVHGFSGPRLTPDSFKLSLETDRWMCRWVDGMSIAREHYWANLSLLILTQEILEKRFQRASYPYHDRLKSECRGVHIGLLARTSTSGTRSYQHEW